MKNQLSKFGAWASTLPILLLPMSVSAQLTKSSTDLKAVGDTLGQDTSGASLPKVVGNLINVLLSVLGIIFVVLVVYAGYLYLTASGDDKKVEKAKKLLGQAVIGMVIIIAAYSISTFVIDNLAGVAKK